MRNFILKAIPLLLGVVFIGVSFAQEAEPLPGSEECAMCHEPGRMSRSREEAMPPNFGEAVLRKSPHAGIECNNCHMDLMGADIPHEEKLEKVDCGICHSDESEQFDQSLHGQAIERGDKLAPNCTSCHGTPEILTPGSVEMSGQGA